MQQMFRWIEILFLIICSLTDIKEKKIHITHIIIFLPIIVCGAIFCDVRRGYFEGTDLIIGFVMILLSFITKDNIGLGDGVCVLSMGLLWGYEMQLRVVIMALLLLCITGGVLLLIGKIKRKEPLPFVPFLTVSLIGHYLYMKGGG